MPATHFGEVLRHAVPPAPLFFPRVESTQLTALFGKGSPVIVLDGRRRFGKSALARCTFRSLLDLLPVVNGRDSISSRDMDTRRRFGPRVRAPVGSGAKKLRRRDATGPAAAFRKRVSVVTVPAMPSEFDAWMLKRFALKKLSVSVDLLTAMRQITLGGVLDLMFLAAALYDLAEPNQPLTPAALGPAIQALLQERENEFRVRFSAGPAGRVLTYAACYADADGVLPPMTGCAAMTLTNLNAGSLRHFVTQLELDPDRMVLNRDDDNRIVFDDPFFRLWIVRRMQTGRSS